MELDDALALQRAGRIDEAIRAYEAALSRDPASPRALQYLGLACMQQGNLDRAEALLQRSLAADPNSVSALNDAGALHVRRGRHQQALGLFQKALELDGANADVLLNAGTTLLRLRQPQLALPYVQEAARLRPLSAEVLFELGRVHLQLSDMSRAAEHFRRAVELDPAFNVARVMLGDAYEALGNFKRARLHYLSAVRREPNSALPLAKLLALREGETRSEWVERAHALIADVKTPPAHKMRLHVSLGSFYDRTKSYDDAFRHYKLGNDYQAGKAPFDSDGYSAAIDRLMEVFSKDFFATAPRSGVSSRRPLFIVGMPRSGTTLTEQILASHPDVAAGGELTAMFGIARQVQSIAGSREAYPMAVRHLTEASLAGLAGRYLERLDRVEQSDRRVTDKLPFNFMHLGLIALMFPDAVVVHCRREPLDTCVSCFFVSFADEIQFATDLTALGRYYVDYARLMTHWRSALPVRIHEVCYEELVGDTERSVRSLLQFCGLEWNERCLDFHKNRRGVRTPSRWQVRQPIYSGSVGRWKRYEGHLAPLQGVLARAGVL